MKLSHLESDYIDDIALGLDEDVYGANGDLDAFEVTDRVVAKIHEATGHAYVESGMIPVRAAAVLVQSVWAYKDRQWMDEIADPSGSRPLPDTLDLAIEKRANDRFAAAAARPRGDGIAVTVPAPEGEA